MRRGGACPICRAAPLTIVDSSPRLTHEKSFSAEAKRPALLRRVTSGLAAARPSGPFAWLAESAGALLLSLLLVLGLIPESLSPAGLFELPRSAIAAFSQLGLLAAWWLTFTVVSHLLNLISPSGGGTD